MAAYANAAAPADDVASSAAQDQATLPEGPSTGLAKWLRYLVVDSGVGVCGNLLTTLLTCLLAYALLFPQGLFPEGYRLAVVQSEFFAARFGGLGRIIFLVVAAAFLCDTWIVTMESVARIHADLSRAVFRRLRTVPTRRLYYLFLAAGSTMTVVTLPMATPGALILLMAVIGFIGTVIYTWGLVALNYGYLPSIAPETAPRGGIGRALLVLSASTYTLLAILYVVVLLRS